LIEFDSLDFDIIMKMKWLCTYGVKIDCEDLKVISRDEWGREICFMGNKRKNLALQILLWKQVSCYVKNILGIGVVLLTLNHKKKKQKISL